MSQFIDEARAEGVPKEGLYHLEMMARFFGMEPDPDPYFLISDEVLAGWVHAVLLDPEDHEARDWSFDWIEPYLEEHLAAKYPDINMTEDFGEAIDRIMTERVAALPEPPRGIVMTFQGFDEETIKFHEMTARASGLDPDLSVDIDAEEFAQFVRRDMARAENMDPAIREEIETGIKMMTDVIEQHSLTGAKRDVYVSIWMRTFTDLVKANEEKAINTIH